MLLILNGFRLEVVLTVTPVGSTEVNRSWLLYIQGILNIECNFSSFSLSVFAKQPIAIHYGPLSNVSCSTVFQLLL